MFKLICFILMTALTFGLTSSLAAFSDSPLTKDISYKPASHLGNEAIMWNYSLYSYNLVIYVGD